MLIRTRRCSEHPTQGAGEDELQKANRRKASALPFLTRHGARWDREVLCANKGWCQQGGNGHLPSHRLPVSEKKAGDYECWFTHQKSFIQITRTRREEMCITGNVATASQLWSFS